MRVPNVITQLIQLGGVAYLRKWLRFLSNELQQNDLRSPNFIKIKRAVRVAQSILILLNRSVVRAAYYSEKDYVCKAPLLGLAAGSDVSTFVQ